MRGRMVVWTVAVAALGLVVVAGAATDGMLDEEGLAKQASQNRALARYLKYNGKPEMAEVRPIVDQQPWDDHEVTLYYLSHRREISFARARVLGRPEVHVSRYERALTDADVRALEARGTRLTGAAAPDANVQMASACTGSAPERAECAAGRAESAADRVDQAAVRAEKAADRTEAVVAKMSTPSGRTSRHRQSKASKTSKTSTPEPSGKSS